MKSIFCTLTTATACLPHEILRKFWSHHRLLALQNIMPAPKSPTSAPLQNSVLCPRSSPPFAPSLLSAEHCAQFHVNTTWPPQSILLIPNSPPPASCNTTCSISSLHACFSFCAQPSCPFPSHHCCAPAPPKHSARFEVVIPVLPETCQATSFVPTISPLLLPSTVCIILYRVYPKCYHCVLECNNDETKVSSLAKNTVGINMEHLARFLSRLCDVSKSDLERIYGDLCMIATVWSIARSGSYGSLIISICKTRFRAATRMPAFWNYWQDLYSSWYADSYMRRRSV